MWETHQGRRLLDGAPSLSLPQSFVWSQDMGRGTFVLSDSADSTVHLHSTLEALGRRQQQGLPGHTTTQSAAQDDSSGAARAVSRTS